MPVNKKKVIKKGGNRKKWNWQFDLKFFSGIPFVTTAGVCIDIEIQVFAFCKIVSVRHLGSAVSEELSYCPYCCGWVTV